MSDPQIAQRFRARRARQVVASLVALGAGVAVYVLQDRLSLMWIPFAVIALVLVFSLRNWRCPACNAYLGRSVWPQRCPSCGVSFRPGA